MPRPSNYPWDRILNGEPWLLHPNVDFFDSFQKMRARVHAAALYRDVAVKTWTHEGSLAILATGPRQKSELPRSADPVPPGRGRGKYPWHLFLSATGHVLRRGEDFEVKVEAFRTAAWKAARARDLILYTEVRDSSHIWIQVKPGLHWDAEWPPDPEYLK